MMNVFTALSITKSLAEQMADDARLSASERVAMQSLSKALSSFSGAAFALRDWSPQQTKAGQ